MEQIVNRARELLSENIVQVVIGYERSSKGGGRPVFITNSKDVDKLIYDESCFQNLAVYLLKPEVKQLGRIAIVAPLPVLKSVIQLSSENQIKDEEVIVLGVSPDNKLIEFDNFKSIENYLSSFAFALTNKEKEIIEGIKKLSLEERFAYWIDILSECFKCYACRAACPMCYCHRCIVECNQPQWIPVASHTLGNFEWHIVRAMHLAGRCVNCDACSNSCPLNIPLNLFNKVIAEFVFEKFGHQAGMKIEQLNVLSVYKPDDKENFII